ncbi:MAG: DUF192 domain-containing protein [Anaerolineales bacterium]|jgi:uncharacterized membrane protein (UPF0127 family)
MAEWIDVFKSGAGGQPLVRARWCQSFLCRLRGLTFRQSLEPGEGLLLVDRSEGRMSASIHMWMVFFPIGVIWLNSRRAVVDTIVAKPWRIYLPSAAAQYILETQPGVLADVQVGDRLEWRDAS